MAQNATDSTGKTVKTRAVIPKDTVRVWARGVQPRDASVNASTTGNEGLYDFVPLRSIEFNPPVGRI